LFVKDKYQSSSAKNSWQVVVAERLHADHTEAVADTSNFAEREGQINRVKTASGQELLTKGFDLH
jgi:hypothetical protein